jgi:hypothetical protein
MSGSTGFLLVAFGLLLLFIAVTGKYTCLENCAYCLAGYNPSSPQTVGSAAQSPAVAPGVSAGTGPATLPTLPNLPTLTDILNMGPGMP